MAMASEVARPRSAAQWARTGRKARSRSSTTTGSAATRADRSTLPLTGEYTWVQVIQPSSVAEIFGKDSRIKAVGPQLACRGLAGRAGRTSAARLPGRGGAEVGPAGPASLLTVHASGSHNRFAAQTGRQRRPAWTS